MVDCRKLIQTSQLPSFSTSLIWPHISGKGSR